MNFGDFIGNGAQLWHWTERISFEVHIQSCNDNTDSIVGKLVAYINQTTVEELCFINTYYIYLGSKMLADESMGVEAIEWLS